MCDTAAWVTPARSATALWLRPNRLRAAARSVVNGVSVCAFPFLISLSLSAKVCHIILAIYLRLHSASSQGELGRKSFVDRKTHRLSSPPCAFFR